MSIRDNILNNPKYVLSMVLELIDDEKSRILANKLADQEHWHNFFGPVKTMILKDAKLHRNSEKTVSQLLGMHNLLKSIKLPGDFEKIAEEKLYIILDTPYEESVEKDIVEKDECVECKKENEECEECEEENVEDILANAVNIHLQKIAETLANKGNHKAAYLVERTIRSISMEAENGKLFSK